MSRDYVLLLNVSEIVAASMEEKAAPKDAATLRRRTDICWRSTLAAIAEAWSEWAMQRSFLANPAEPVNLVLMLTMGDGMTPQQYATLQLLQTAGYTVIEALEDKQDHGDGSPFAELWQALRLGEWLGWRDIFHYVRLRYRLGTHPGWPEC